MPVPPSKIKALFFDVFGTLVDWRSNVARDASLGVAGWLGSFRARGGSSCRRRPRDGMVLLGKLFRRPGKRRRREL